MNDLRLVALLVGAVSLFLSVPALTVPRKVGAWLGAFPRDWKAAWILTAAALGLATWFLYGSQLLADISWAKTLVVVMAPVAFLLIVCFMDELLAPRALGGLFMLVPEPMLAAAMWHDTPWRFVITILAYILVPAGIVLMLSPWHFRQAVRFLAGSASRCRLAGACLAVFGVCVLILGITVY